MIIYIHVVSNYLTCAIAIIVTFMYVNIVKFRSGVEGGFQLRLVPALPCN